MTKRYPCGMVVTMTMPLTPGTVKTREEVLEMQCDNEHAATCRVCAQ